MTKPKFNPAPDRQVWQAQDDEGNLAFELCITPDRLVEVRMADQPEGSEEVLYLSKKTAENLGRKLQACAENCPLPYRPRKKKEKEEAPTLPLASPASPTKQ